VSSPTAPPEQAAFTSKAAIGPKPRLRAMAGAVGHNRYSGVKVAQIRQSGCWADWVASACLAAATPRLWVVSPGATTRRDWIPQRDSIQNGATPNWSASSRLVKVPDGYADPNPVIRNLVRMSGEFDATVLIIIPGSPS
jgi:hypothetical protein